MADSGPGKAEEAAGKAEEAAGKAEEAAGNADEATRKPEEATGKDEKAAGNADEAAVKPEEVTGNAGEAVGKAEEVAEKEPDDRIPCRNSASLDEILKIAIKHVNKGIESSIPSVEKRSQFLKRFTEQFCEIMHQNVTVNGLPWSTSSDLISGAQVEQQVLEKDDANRSLLATAVEVVAARRKYTCKDVVKILDMEMKHSRQTVRSLKIKHPPLPSPAYRPPMAAFPHEELAEILSDIEFSQMKIDSLEEELSKVQFAHDIMERQNVNDTGYMSS